MAFAVSPACIGCGTCESACPTAAVHQDDGYVVTYWIDPLACDDCGRCVGVCPVGVIVPDPAFAVCSGRGCPITSRRYEGWTCSRGTDRCELCGGSLWTSPAGATRCPECRRSAGEASAACPKVRQLARRQRARAGTAG